MSCYLHEVSGVPDNQLGHEGDWASSPNGTLYHKAGGTWSVHEGNTSPSSLSLSGVTGATAGTRFAGATSSGAPTTGTFLAGDMVVDLTGQMWVCISAGSPGTWTAVGSGQQLVEAESTAAYDVQANSTTPADVTGLSITVPATSRPFVLHAYLMTAMNSGTAAANSVLQIIAQITDNSNNILAYGADSHIAITNVSSTRRGIIDMWSKPQAAIASPTTYKVRARLAAAAPTNWTSAQFQGGYGFSPAQPYFFEAIGR